jgi:hypothetical protein
MTEETQKKRRLPAYFYKGSTITGFVLIIVFAIAAIFLLTFGKQIQTFLGVAGLPTAGNGAHLLLTPATQTTSVGQTFTATITLNGGNDSTGTPNQVLTAGAYLTFDKTKLQAMGVDTSTSAFTTGIIESNSDCTSNCRYDNVNGKINISAAQASPGVSGSNLVVAVITFKALATGTIPVNFDFTTARTSNSQVVVWDTSANAPADILDGVTNGSYTVNVAAPTTASTVTLTDTDATAGNETYNNQRSANTLRFTYTAVANATSYAYRVLEGTTQIKASTAISVTPGQTTTITALPLVNGHTYRIEVVASNATGSGPAGYSPNVKTTSGDVNDDGTVGFADFQAFALKYGTAFTNVATNMPDINGDGTVNFSDLSYIAQNYGQSL